MPNLTQMEFNAIREITGCHTTCASKLTEYAEKSTDGQIKQMFSKAAQECHKSVQNLSQML